MKDPNQEVLARFASVEARLERIEQLQLQLLELLADVHEEVDEAPARDLNGNILPPARDQGLPL